MNYRFIFHLLALVVVAIGLGILISAGVAALYGEDDVSALLISAGISLAIGIPLYSFTPLAERTYINYREGFIVVGTSWFVAMFFGALPYMIYGMFSPLDALFESMSGFTTTGASVLTDFDQPHGILFWRSLTHWYGGMGIIVLFIAILPPLGGGAIRLFAAESPGPVPGRLTPKIRDTARGLWYIYLGLSALEVIVLLILGMPLYDSVTHTFGTMATGGFSPLATSIAAYDSWAIELAIILFMILAGGNFALYFALVWGGGTRLYKDAEFRFYLAIMSASVLLVTISLIWAGSHDAPLQALRDAAFQVVSLQTTTGYVSHDFDTWNSFAKTILIILMFVGGSAGSTAGGFKVARLLVLSKNARHDLTRQVHPQAVLPVKIGGRPVQESVRTTILGYFFLYVMTFVVGALLISTSDLGLLTTVSATAATLNNIGPGLDLVGATLNYAPVDPFAKSSMIVLMVMGRLELLPVLLPLTRRFWRR